MRLNTPGKKKRITLNRLRLAFLTYTWSYPAVDVPQRITTVRLTMSKNVNAPRVLLQATTNLWDFTHLVLLFCHCRLYLIPSYLLWQAYLQSAQRMCRRHQRHMQPLAFRSSATHSTHKMMRYLSNCISTFSSINFTRSLLYAPKNHGKHRIECWLRKFYLRRPNKMVSHFRSRKSFKQDFGSEHFEGKYHENNQFHFFYIKPIFNMSFSSAH